MIILENELIRAGFVTKGAEWRSWSDRALGREFLWQADPAYWAKTAPILFPIVGSLKDGVYRYQGRSYALPRHGFARDREFQVVLHEPTRVVFRQTSDAETLAVYPFNWELEVEYRLWQSVVQTSFRVRNTGSGPMFFSIGAHPAFAVPPGGDGRFDDAFIDFELPETCPRRLLDSHGLLSGETRPLPSVGRTLVLTRPLFAEDAVILSGLRSRRLTLRSRSQTASLSLEFPGFSHLGLWSAPDAPFVCLEPWCGLSDSADASGDLETKEGIERLDAGAVFGRSFALTLAG